jgi:hypothetical protein
MLLGRVERHANRAPQKMQAAIRTQEVIEFNDSLHGQGFNTPACPNQRT